MSILVLAEHNNSELKSSTLSAISAALQINENIDVLVVGSECENIVNKLKNVHKINKIIIADNEIFLNPIAELISPILNSLSENYSHFVAPASTYGKNIMPRLAAFLDVSQISDIVKVEDSDTFVRPIYAGNALATVQSTDKKKLLQLDLPHLILFQLKVAMPKLKK